MKKNQFIQYLSEANFYPFFNELGWDNAGNQYNTIITIDEVDYEMNAIAQKRGFMVYVCEVDTVPQNALCRKIDIRLRKYSNDYILIFKETRTNHHLWVAPIKTIEKRELITIEYIDATHADFLYSKIGYLSFGIDECVTIVDVTTRIQDAFEVNSGKITKDFYAGFKKEHTSFMQFIEGIDVEGDKQWYTSVMLNRLMFCYFIQKKGFLNFDTDYLRHKLRWTQEQQGENRFFGSFYKGFLCALFQGGLNSPQHSTDFENKYGRIPYLNGGMFDKHQIEAQYAHIDIADEAFEKLFIFFDKWRWHLDTRITASGKDINPDVLGYIFEQYINDRAQMGAYYTKEDITEYIGKNCIIPFLMDEVAKTSSQKHFESTGFVWQTLKKSGDKYIYDAVKKGQDLQLPPKIEIGIDTTIPNLLERRSEWNKPAEELYALPTEIWRETVERLQRCADIKQKIAAGEITQINDFITYNLDIRSFAFDLLAKTDDHLLVKHFYAALTKVTILDPTCGSGAFLFAALNILEPLYEICIDRMEVFNQQNPHLFKEELDEIKNKYRSNIQYFVYKSIILRNLYGVDIMPEATEIAKLRLFLKMVAVVDVDKRADNLGLDPLPDIDFNIRCGNTLIGYATEAELNKDLIFGDMFAREEFKQKIEDEMAKVAIAYGHFKEIQFCQHEDITLFKKAKEELNDRLQELNTVLNKKLYESTTTYSSTHGGLTYNEWLNSHQPFHWLAEFYQIINGNGGFDVIIGNPPYVEQSKITYSVNAYKTIKCGNLYAYVVERCFQIANRCAKIGMIVPISSVCTNRMIEYQKILLRKKVWNSLYAERPSKLFSGAEVQLVISIMCPDENEQNIYSSKYNKWGAEYRSFLFQNIYYESVLNIVRDGSFPKIGTCIEKQILSKISDNKRTISSYQIKKSNDYVSYRNAGGRYYKVVLNYEPEFRVNGITKKSSTYQSLYFENNQIANSICCLMNSGLFFWYWINFSDTWHLVNREIGGFPIDLERGVIKELNLLNCELMTDYLKKSTERIENRNKGKDSVEFRQFNARDSKSIIDKIDVILAQHYRFTEEELDFIINYDIKYRMGDELTNEE